MKTYELNLKFNFDQNTLYELGLFSTDLYQLIVFYELLQNDELDLIEEYFLHPKPFAVTRNNHLLRGFRDRAKIKSINNGSIEMIIAGVSCAATIIVPYSIYRLQKKDNNESQEIFFEISTNDQEINQLLDQFNEGLYEKGIQALQWLINNLNERGYKSQTLNRSLSMREYMLFLTLDN